MGKMGSGGDTSVGGKAQRGKEGDLEARLGELTT